MLPCPKKASQSKGGKGGKEGHGAAARVGGIGKARVSRKRPFLLTNNRRKFMLLLFV
jgi:hypothetical protein